MNAWPTTQNMRTWLDILDARGELGTVDSPISPDREVAAVLEHRDGRRAVRFRHVTGSPFTLAGNLVHHRDHLAAALGCPVDAVAERFSAALRAPEPCRSVPPGDAPVLADRLVDDAPLTTLPLTVQHDRDGGRYFTSALLAVLDPASGLVNLSINRLMAVDGREVRALVLPGRLREILAETERSGRALDVGIAVGVDPLLILASQSPADRLMDDLGVASALRGSPLPVTTLPGTAITVPAEAEFLLKGTFRVGERAIEGPFGEYPRTYSPAAPAPVIDIDTVWHRTDATFQAILSGGREHLLVGGVPREARLLGALRDLLPATTAVRFTEGGSCRMHVVVALHNPRPGDAFAAIMVAFGAVTTVKLVTVVNDDIDIFDDEQVAWAVATRVQADRDLLVVPRTRGSSLDPSADGGLTAKAGIDATVQADRADRHARMTVTPSDSATINAFLSEVDRS